ncbi:MAG: hypothetical protein HY866_16980, partial [Chloroflexi bacterium]|nr:hypothetical protein [Chloroflexota bacterium]
MKKLCLACFLLIVCSALKPANAQNDAPFFTLTHQIGRGHVQSLEWHPTQDVILVSTIRGAWFYDAELHDLGHIEEARLATFSPNGEWVAGVNAENQITLWESKTYAPAGKMAGHEALVTAIAWSPSGELLATGDREGNLIVWNSQQQRAIVTRSVSGAVQILRWNSDNTRLAVFTIDTVLQVYDLRQENPVFEAPPVRCCGAGASVDVVWIDKSTVARVVSGDGGERHQWNTDTGDLISGAWPQVDLELWLPSAISPDKTLSAQGHTTGVKIIDQATREELRMVEIPFWWVTALTWSSDSTRLIGVGAYSEIYLWDVSTGTLLAENREHAKPEPRGAWLMGLGDPNIAGLPSWSADSQLLAVPDDLIAISIWDSTTGTRLTLLEGHTAPVVKAAWYPEDHWVATIQDCWFDGEAVVKIWDGDTGSLIDQYAQGGCPRSIAWRPEDHILVSVSD